MSILRDNFNFRELCVTLTSEQIAFTFLLLFDGFSLVCEGGICPKCENGFLYLVDECADNVRCVFRCNYHKCRRRVSQLYGTFMYNSNLQLTTLLSLIYCWLFFKGNNSAIRETGCSSATVCRWFYIFRTVGGLVAQKESCKIGGPGVIVEIDESLFFKRKYGKGSKKSNEAWILGGVERDDCSKCFLEEVADRKAPTLKAVIKKYVLPGTLIITDGWKSYQTLKNEGYEHFAVNHSIEFVSSDDPRVHTNSVEGMWRHAKQRMPSTGTSERYFGSYLAEFIYRRLRKNSKCLYKQFIVDLREFGTEALEAIGQSDDESA